MLKHKGRDVFETLREMVDPRHTAVVVHDMQNDYVSKGGAFDKAGMLIGVSDTLPPLVTLVDRARRSGVEVMYTHGSNELDFGSFNDPMVSKRWAQLKDPSKHGIANPTVNGTWGWQTMDELKPREGEAIISKYRPDAFIGTNFELLLRSHGIRTIIHTGIATAIGMLPTVWHAVHVGFFPIVPRDLVGPQAPESHADAMKFMTRLAWVVDSSEILEAWRTKS
jgi:nicotinamidase-related amidase